MRHKFIIIAVALVALGAAAGGAMYYMYPVQVNVR
jgi:hypothetical protein